MTVTLTLGKILRHDCNGEGYAAGGEVDQAGQVRAKGKVKSGRTAEGKQEGETLYS